MNTVPLVLYRKKPKIHIVRAVVAHAMFEGLLPRDTYVVNLHPLDYIRAGWQSMSITFLIDVIRRSEKVTLIANIFYKNDKIRLKLSNEKELVCDVFIPTHVVE